MAHCSGRGRHVDIHRVDLLGAWGTTTRTVPQTGFEAPRCARRRFEGEDLRRREDQSPSARLRIVTGVSDPSSKTETCQTRSVCDMLKDPSRKGAKLDMIAGSGGWERETTPKIYMHMRSRSKACRIAWPVYIDVHCLHRSRLLLHSMLRCIGHSRIQDDPS